MAKELDEVDQELLTTTQRNFPLVAEPYKAIGDRLGIDADEVIERLKDLKVLVIFDV